MKMSHQTIRYILGNYVHLDLIQLIINIAFTCKNTKDYFKLGYYEKCIELIKNVNKLTWEFELKYKLLDRYLYEACLGGHMKIVKILTNTELEITTDRYGLFNYIVNNYIKLTETRTLNMNLGFDGACSGGHIEIVKLMIRNGGDRFDKGLFNACKKNYVAIINLLIKQSCYKYNIDWNEGFFGACEGGHSKIINKMILKLNALPNNNNVSTVGFNNVALGSGVLNNINITARRNFNILPIERVLDWNRGILYAYKSGHIDTFVQACKGTNLEFNQNYIIHYSNC